jgi:hypothetical protein
MNGRFAGSVVAGIIAILLVDVGAGYIPKMTGISDQWFLIPTLIVYAATGFAAGWRRSLAAATAAALIVAFIDVTLGWWIGTLIDPNHNRFEGTFASFVAVVMTFKTNLALGALCGIGAGVAARRMAARPGTSDTSDVELHV